MNHDLTQQPAPLWTAEDVARYFQASKSYVYKAAEAGTLPCIRIGNMLRFQPAQIIASLDQAKK